ncbi:MAG: biopolymer transporter ExbD [Bacteroidia bacterium]|jgi:biopolymer transport protein ExbD|nr:biopolymer transporter ExbD [Bacteroidia bacterium]
MAEVQDSGGGNKKGKKIRSKKHSTHVDMTPMVDLAFLLLTFFLFTTTLNKPKAMEVMMPDDQIENPNPPEIKASNAMTILLSEKRAYYYFGFEDPKVESANYGPNGIRKAIITKKKECESRVNSKGEPERVTILIKPFKDAKYRNIVDILDEMNINDIKAYAIVDITPKEIEMIEGLATK